MLIVLFNVDVFVFFFIFGKKLYVFVQRSMWQVARSHPVHDYHTVIPFQHKRSTKQAKHETRNKQKATKIKKFRHLVISIEII
jgi:hypothetical protein